MLQFIIMIAFVITLVSVFEGHIAFEKYSASVAFNLMIYVVIEDRLKEGTEIWSLIQGFVCAILYTVKWLF